MTYKGLPGQEWGSSNDYRPLTTRPDSRSRRQQFRPSKAKLLALVIATVLLAMIFAKPVSLWNAAIAFGGTYIEGIFGDNTVTVGDVQGVLMDELTTNEVIGEATRKMRLTNVKVRIDESGTLGLGSELLRIAEVTVRARAIVRGDELHVQQGLEGFEITLPSATLDSVYIPIDEPINVERERNLVTRLSDLVGGVTPEQLIRSEIANVALQAAESDNELLRKAEMAAAGNIERLLSTIGVKQVTVRFVD